MYNMPRFLGDVGNEAGTNKEGNDSCPESGSRLRSNHRTEEEEAEEPLFVRSEWELHFSTSKNQVLQSIHTHFQTHLPYPMTRTDGQCYHAFPVTHSARACESINVHAPRRHKQVYYHNARTGQSSWELPPDERESCFVLAHQGKVHVLDSVCGKIDPLTPQLASSLFTDTDPLPADKSAALQTCPQGEGLALQTCPQGASDGVTYKRAAPPSAGVAYTQSQTPPRDRSLQKVGFRLPGGADAGTRVGRTEMGVSTSARRRAMRLMEAGSEKAARNVLDGGMLSSKRAALLLVSAASKQEEHLRIRQLVCALADECIAPDDGQEAAHDCLSMYRQEAALDQMEPFLEEEVRWTSDAFLEEEVRRTSDGPLGHQVDLLDNQCLGGSLASGRRLAMILSSQLVYTLRTSSSSTRCAYACTYTRQTSSCSSASKCVRSKFAGTFS